MRFLVFSLLLGTVVASSYAGPNADLLVSMRNLSSDECRLVRKVRYDGQFYNSNVPEVIPVNGESYYFQFNNDPGEASLELTYKCGDYKLAHFLLKNTSKSGHRHMSVALEPIEVENLNLQYTKSNSWRSIKVGYVHTSPSRIDMTLRD